MQRSELCRSRRELSNAYLLTKFGFDTAENEPCKDCPLSAYRSPRSALEDRLAKGNKSVEDRLTRMDQSLLEMKQSIGYIVQALEAGKRYDI